MKENLKIYFYISCCLLFCFYMILVILESIKRNKLLAMEIDSEKVKAKLISEMCNFVNRDEGEEKTKTEDIKYTTITGVETNERMESNE